MGTASLSLHQRSDPILTTSPLHMLARIARLRCPQQHQEKEQSEELSAHSATCPSSAILSRSEHCAMRFWFTDTAMEQTTSVSQLGLQPQAQKIYLARSPPSLGPRLWRTCLRNGRILRLVVLTVPPQVPRIVEEVLMPVLRLRRNPSRTFLIDL